MHTYIVYGNKRMLSIPGFLPPAADPWVKRERRKNFRHIPIPSLTYLTLTNIFAHCLRGAGNKLPYILLNELIFPE